MAQTVDSVNITSDDDEADDSVYNFFLYVTFFSQRFIAQNICVRLCADHFHLLPRSSSTIHIHLNLLLLLC